MIPTPLLGPSFQLDQSSTPEPRVEPEDARELAMRVAREKGWSERSGMWSMIIDVAAAAVMADRKRHASAARIEK